MNIVGEEKLKPEALSSPRHLKSAVGVVLVLWQEVANVNLIVDSGRFSKIEFG